MTDNQKIDEIINSLKNYDLGDIEKTNAMDPKIPIATFILCSCFIDHMAQHRYFQNDHKVGPRFKKFVKNYLGAKYNPAKLYDSLRSRLVHNYSTNGAYILGWPNANDHLKINAGDGRVILSLDKFIDDIKLAFTSFCNDIRNNPDAKQRALAHFSVMPVVMLQKPGVLSE